MKSDCFQGAHRPGRINTDRAGVGGANERWVRAQPVSMLVKIYTEFDVHRRSEATRGTATATDPPPRCYLQTLPAELIVEVFLYCEGGDLASLECASVFCKSQAWAAVGTLLSPDLRELLLPVFFPEATTRCRARAPSYFEQVQARVRCWGEYRFGLVVLLERAAYMAVLYFIETETTNVRASPANIQRDLVDFFFNVEEGAPEAAAAPDWRPGIEIVLGALCLITHGVATSPESKCIQTAVLRIWEAVGHASLRGNFGEDKRLVYAVTKSLLGMAAYNHCHYPTVYDILVLASRHGQGRVLLDAGAVPVMLACVAAYESGKGNLRACQTALAVLGVLAADPEGCAMFMAAEGIRLLTHFIRTAGPAALVAQGRALATIARLVAHHSNDCTTCIPLRDQLSIVATTGVLQVHQIRHVQLLLGQGSDPEDAVLLHYLQILRWVTMVPLMKELVPMLVNQNCLGIIFSSIPASSELALRAFDVMHCLIREYRASASRPGWMPTIGGLLSRVTECIVQCDREPEQHHTVPAVVLLLDLLIDTTGANRTAAVESLPTSVVEHMLRTAASETGDHRVAVGIVTLLPCTRYEGMIRILGAPCLVWLKKHGPATANAFVVEALGRLGQI